MRNPGVALAPSTIESGVAFARPDISAAEIGAVLATLHSGWLTTGPKVEEFERRFAEYVGAPHAIAVSSCTAALHLSLLASGVGPGSEVVTTPLTFCATVNAIIHCGATPIFADVDPRTMNIDTTGVRAAMSPRTQAIVPVHFAGRPADIATLRDIATRADVRLVEDAAHALGATVDGTRVGALGDLTCFSFYSTKNLTTGEEEWSRRRRTNGRRPCASLRDTGSAIPPGLAREPTGRPTTMWSIQDSSTT